MECYVFKKVLLVLFTLVVLLNLCSAFKVSFPKFKFADINGTCSTDQDCIVDNSFCDNSTVPNTCQCIPKSVFYKPKDSECGTNLEASCLPNRDIDEICAVDEQCQAVLGPLSESSNASNCICWHNATYHYFVTTNYPCQYPATKLGDPCYENRFTVTDCKNIPHALCAQRKCSCPADMVEHPEIPNHCIPLAQEVGGACDAALYIQCSALNDTVCNEENRCLCKNSSFIPNSRNNGCVPLVMELNASCEMFEQCGMQLGFCNKTQILANGSCQCLPGSVASSANMNMCVKIANTTHRHCVEQVQCTAAWGAEAECVDESCSCKPGAFLHNRKCIPKRKLHDECQRSEQCEQINLVYLVCKLDRNCTENKLTCQCPLTHGSVGDKCYPKTGVGLRCSKSEDCVTIAQNDSAFICQSRTNKCVCPDNTRLSLDKSRCIPRSVEQDDVCEISAQCNTDSNQFCKAGRCASKADSMNALCFYAVLVLALMITKR